MANEARRAHLAHGLDDCRPRRSRAEAASLVGGPHWRRHYQRRMGNTRPNAGAPPRRESTVRTDSSPARTFFPKMMAKLRQVAQPQRVVEHPLRGIIRNSSEAAWQHPRPVLLSLAPNFFVQRLTAGVRSPQNWLCIRIARSREAWMADQSRCLCIISGQRVQSREFIAALRVAHHLHPHEPLEIIMDRRRHGGSVLENDRRQATSR